MCQNAFFPCLQEIRMCRSKREEQKSDVRSDKKKIQQLDKKNHCFFEIFFKKSFILKQIVKKNILKCLLYMLVCWVKANVDIQKLYGLFVKKVNTTCSYLAAIRAIILFDVNL